MAFGGSVADVALIMHAHPTLAEAFREQRWSGWTGGASLADPLLARQKKPEADGRYRRPLAFFSAWSAP